MTSMTMWPALNATLNATCAVLLTGGYCCIRARRIMAHTLCMLGACLVSGLFLASYLLYHARVGSVPFQGHGWARPVYFAILLSHTVLAVAIVPMIWRTLRLAMRRQFEAHRGFARVTLPLWLYVSVTGVLVYVLLYGLPGTAHACPMCREAVADSSSLVRDRIVRGYAFSTIALLGTPLILVGSLTTMIVRSARRARRNRQ